MSDNSEMGYKNIYIFCLYILGIYSLYIFSLYILGIYSRYIFSVFYLYICSRYIFSLFFLCILHMIPIFIIVLIPPSFFWASRILIDFHFSRFINFWKNAFVYIHTLSFFISIIIIHILLKFCYFLKTMVSFFQLPTCSSVSLS